MQKGRFNTANIAGQIKRWRNARFAAEDSDRYTLRRETERLENDFE